MVSEHANVYHKIGTVENYSEIHTEVQRFIEANYDKPISITDVVQARGVSQRQIHRALAWHDTSWSRMLLNERHKRAKELLAYSGETLDTIAKRVGQTPMQLNRTLKAEEGMDAEEYRTWIRSQQQT